MALTVTDVTIEPGTSPIIVDGSAVTQPISGTVTANAGTGTFLVDGSAHTQPVSGTVAVSSVSGSVAVTGPLTDTQLRATPVPISGSVSTTPVTSSSATITRVATSNVAVTLLAANANRKKAIITTETGATQYLAFGSTASSTNYTYLLGSTSTLEVTTWTGSISLVRSSGSGNVQVTELV